METYGRPSRFLREIPGELLHEVRPRVQVSRPLAPARGHAVLDDVAPLKLGQRVRHAKFGEGVFADWEGRGEPTRVQVNFEEAGQNWPVLPSAPLGVL